MDLAFDIYMVSSRPKELTGPFLKFFRYSNDFIIYPNAGRNQLIQRQPLLVQDKQQANPLLSKNNYTPIVISWNDTNKQLTLLSQRKLALTARNAL
jgi:hypothetical protein